MERVPGAVPGRHIRNVGVVIGSVIAGIGILALLPLVTVVAVASNYRDVATHLSRLPGIDSGGGVKTAVVAGMYALAIWLILLSVGSLSIQPGGDADPSEASAGDSELSEDELLVLFETIATQWNVDVRSATVSDDVFAVEYAANTTTEQEITSEIGSLSGAYIDVVEEGLETERMDVTAVDPEDGTPLVHWHVESAWADEYTAGTLSEEEVLQRVLGTLEPADD
ncbi:hypothetical protein AB7C87_09665 [Natrarchaeobius sp. A-rgal3]|uniref:hypothetical protein n=1 Tax=Natrarchaeobius versutus TaxID=1679078 RepID=UPI0035105A75